MVPSRSGAEITTEPLDGGAVFCVGGRFQPRPWGVADYSRFVRNHRVDIAPARGSLDGRRRAKARFRCDGSVTLKAGDTFATQLPNTKSPLLTDYDLTLQFLSLHKIVIERLMIVMAIAWGSLVVCNTQSLAQTDPAAAPELIESGFIAEEDKVVVSLETELFFLRSEASMVLMDKIRNAVDEQIDKVVGDGASRFVPLDDNYIQRKVVSEEVVVEKLVNDPATERKTKRFLGYAKLCFGSEFTNRVHQAYQLNFKARRLQWTGLVGLLFLCWLGAAYGYLKLDNATRHFYSRRLQTIAIILCLLPLIAAILIAIGWRLF